MTNIETIILEQQVEALSLKVEDLEHEIERLRAALSLIQQQADESALNPPYRSSGINSLVESAEKIWRESFAAGWRDAMKALSKAVGEIKSQQVGELRETSPLR